MISPTVIKDALARWIDAVASTGLTLMGPLAAPPVIELIEDVAQNLVVHRTQGPTTTDEDRIGLDAQAPNPGALPKRLADRLPASRVELILRPEHFLFRPLELPNRAAEFLDGIVRSQIDRLTPWTAAQSAFGWSQPVGSGSDHFTVTVAAAARAAIQRYLDPLVKAGVQSIAVLTAEHGGQPIKVFEQRGGLNLARMRHALIVTLLAAGGLAAAALAADLVLGARLDARKDEFAQRMAVLRADALAVREKAAHSVEAAERTLSLRKRGVPATVMVLETLSQVLPDDTYVTELAIREGRMRLSGVTRNAPALIGLLEGTAKFSRATFFAPTTQSSGEAGERFHIEADVRPLGPPGRERRP